jgi:TRAP-type C4-dicarboxylate transport system substrate-binding protein
MALPPGRTATLAALALVAAFAVGGCTQPVAGPSLILTLASPDAETDPNGPAIDHFVREVARRSSGTMRIDVDWDITPEGVDDWDQVVARSVADGQHDLGLVPSRAWDVLGVTSLRALNTPFLVSSDAAMRAVIRSDLRQGLMAGLPSAGVVGIDLWPSDMRRLFGYEEPLLRPADLAGERIRSPTSKTVTAYLEAMGATVVQTTRSPRNQRGLESGFEGAGTGAAIIATGNVVMFPKVESLVAGDELRSRLQPAQWQILLDAASATRRDQLENFPGDAAWARQFCAGGGKIVATSPGDLADFEKVGRQIRTDLQQEPGTARLIEEIAAVVATVPPPEPITECPASESESAASGHDETSALDGIYVTRVTHRDMLEAGVDDPDTIRENTGRITWTLDGGLWHQVMRANHYLSNSEDSGTYTYEDGRFTLHWGDDEVITAQLDIADDGSIRFHDLHDNLPELQKPTEGFFGQPWRRVGDLPD